MKESLGLSVKGQSVFVIGCGGAGRAVALASAAAGSAKVLLSDLDISRAKRLAAEVESLPAQVRTVAPDLKA